MSAQVINFPAALEAADAIPPRDPTPGPSREADFFVPYGDFE